MLCEELAKCFANPRCAVLLGDLTNLQAFYNILFGIFRNRAKEIRKASYQAFSMLLDNCLSPSFLLDFLTGALTDTAQDKSDRCRELAALLIPYTLSAMQLLGTKETGSTSKQQPLSRRSEVNKSWSQLLGIFLGLCGDQACSVQLTAGQQLPILADAIAREVDVLKTVEDENPFGEHGTISSSETHRVVEELMVFLYSAVQKFTLSPHVRNIV